MAKHHECDKLMKIIRICKIVSMEANSVIIEKLQASAFYICFLIEFLKFESSTTPPKH